MKSSLFLVSTFFFISSFSWAASPTQIDLGTGTPKDKEAMVYSKDKLSVKAGSKIHLTFKNNSMSKGMTHNFVLANPGKGQEIIDASVAAGPDKGWVADSKEIIAKTKLIDAGESVSIDFAAPSAPGDYPYFCTFPGHATMRGTLKVTK